MSLIIKPISNDEMQERVFSNAKGPIFSLLFEVITPDDEEIILYCAVVCTVFRATGILFSNTILETLASLF